MSIREKKKHGRNDLLFLFIGSSDGFPMKQKGCAYQAYFYTRNQKKGMVYLA